MNGLIDIRQVATQILGFLILLWLMRKFAWGPLLGQLEARRHKIAGEFAEAARRQAAADESRAKLEAQLRDIETQKRIKIQEGAAEGQRVAAEMKAEAQQQAHDRLVHAEEEVARELEKAKELLKEKMISISLRGAEKVLREKLDDAHQRKLIGEFIDEVGASR
jgi:F-type H+-transporting ATPase subunit b